MSGVSMSCRGCGAPLVHTFADLGTAPPSNAYLSPHDLNRAEPHIPLKVMICAHCWLCQTVDYVSGEELFDRDYAYFSSFSTSWLAHGEAYAAMIAERLGLTAGSHVLEVAANDGYLLQYFQRAGIPCLGVEPTRSTAEAARAKGIEIVEAFFGTGLARRLRADGVASDLIIANNVLAHVPDVNDFVHAFAHVLKPGGVVSCEFPHLVNLVRQCQFDTIYHEHFSYFTLLAVDEIFRRNGLEIFDVEEIATHGGSLRVYAAPPGARRVGARVDALLARERSLGFAELATYTGFQPRIEAVKDDFLAFLLAEKRAGRRVVGYGAAAKAGTLLNYAGIGPDLIGYVVDRNPVKAGKYLPGSRIPIVEEAMLAETRPDIIVIFPWNLTDEIATQLHYARAWSARFCTAVPELRVF